MDELSIDIHLPFCQLLAFKAYSHPFTLTPPQSTPHYTIFSALYPIKQPTNPNTQPHIKAKEKKKKMTLLQTHSHQTNILYSDPHNPHNHLARGLTHHALGFPDLAAADAYRALSLLESVVDPEGCEFHARRVKSRTSDGGGDGHGVEVEDEGDGDDGEESEPITKEEYDGMIGDVYALLVRGLVECGCLRDAFDFCVRGLELLFPSTSPDNDNGNSNKDGNVTVLEEQMRLIKKAYLARTKRNAGESHDMNVDVNLDGVKVDASALPAQGFARRVLYPWNTHEPDRKAPETMDLLNERLKDVASKCEVRAVALPALHNQQNNHDGRGGGNGGKSEEEVSIQLGLFAKETIPAGEIILRESSMLTATNRLHDDLCDACNAPLPSLPASSSSISDDPTGAGERGGPVPCEGDDCEDTIFCSQKCHDDAQVTYHGAVCGLLEGLESIGRDIPDPKDKADYLYLLLLGRAIAMAATQGVHPLDLPEVKYIWGDFHDYTPTSPPDTHTQEGKLPFSFHLSILQPTRLLEEMALDPYAVLSSYDTWILNTLYAKFRGTASGRLSTWDGGPELCAVHPLWCLANHSCAPNVRWEWGGEITFCVRAVDERGVWRGRHTGKERSEAVGDKQSEAAGGGGDGRFNGIRQDEEILNHYCDIGLDVKERREWARGALGGMCLCSRCLWEDAN